MANLANVGQHVVPKCYLKHFGDARGTIHVQEKGTSKVFPSGPGLRSARRTTSTLYW